MAYLLVPISLYFDNKGFVKLIFGLRKRERKNMIKDKQLKEKDWNIKKSRILKNN